VNEMAIRATTAKAASARLSQWVEDPVDPTGGAMVVAVMAEPLSPGTDVFVVLPPRCA
jgi:hypothetical protein